MVVKIIALRLKFCRVKLSNISIPSFHSVSISCIRGSRKTTISMPGCLGHKDGQQKIFSLLAQPCRQVVHRQDHRPSAVSASPVTKQIHSIRTQRKPNVPWILSKFQIILLIEFLPLPSISWMSKLSIALLALSILWVGEETS